MKRHWQQHNFVIALLLMGFFSCPLRAQEKAALPPAPKISIAEGAMLRGLLPIASGTTKVQSKDGKDTITGIWRGVPFSVTATRALEQAFAFVNSRQNAFGGFDSETILTDRRDVVVEVAVRADIPKGTRVVDADGVLLSSSAGQTYSPIAFTVPRGTTDPSFTVLDDGLAIIYITEGQKSEQYAFLGISKMPRGSIWYRSDDGAQRPLTIKLLFKLPRDGKEFKFSVRPREVSPKQ